MKNALKEVWEDVKDFFVDAWERIRTFVEQIGGWFWAIYGGLEVIGCLWWLVSGLVALVAAIWKLVGQGVPQ